MRSPGIINTRIKKMACFFLHAIFNGFENHVYKTDINSDISISHFKNVNLERYKKYIC